MNKTFATALSMLCGLAVHAAEPVPAPARATDAEPAVQTSPATPTRAADAGAARENPPRTAAPAAPATARGSADRIELDATQITGNAELPRVLYVVPWKRPELGDLGGRPAKSLLDEVLEPVDRDVFRRQNRYYNALQPDAAAAAPKGEK